MMKFSHFIHCMAIIINIVMILCCTYTAKFVHCATNAHTPQSHALVFSMQFSKQRLPMGWDEGRKQLSLLCTKLD